MMVTKKDSTLLEELESFNLDASSILEMQADDEVTEAATILVNDLLCAESIDETVLASLNELLEVVVDKGRNAIELEELDRAA